MRIILAGYNIDTDFIKEAIKAGASPNGATPETIAAAYARISRHPEPIDQLRFQARQDVEHARESNQKIIFEMGHASVAEHVVLNFDLIDISRLAIEALEHHRLCSYTEKSQRYIKLAEDYFLPTEIAEAGLADAFREFIQYQHQTYQVLYKQLKDYFFSTSPHHLTNKANHHALKGKAKEDARYVLPLATLGQVGLTVNARNLELIIRRMAAHPLSEVKNLAQNLYEVAYPIIPSLLRYISPSENINDSAKGLVSHLAVELQEQEAFHTQPANRGAALLVDATRQGDAIICAAILHDRSGVSWNACWDRAQQMPAEEQARIIQDALRPLSVHDVPPRYFELVSFRFDLVISASCFAQLKRHRMATLLPQPYNPSLGYTMPDSIGKVGLTKEFQSIMNESLKLYKQLMDHTPSAAPYVLTQAHRRRVLLQMNARELYHFARMRLDHHAQWDIRQVAERMINAARQEVPSVLAMACGKDAFKERYQQVLATKSK